MIDLKETFDKFQDNYLAFERIQNPLHKRIDICAFLYQILHFPDDKFRNIVSCTENDEIWLEVSCEKIEMYATEDDILYLVRCGVRYDNDTDSLCMFV